MFFFFIFSILVDFADQIGLHALETTWARLVIVVGLIFYNPPWSALLLRVPIWPGLLANSDFDEDFKFFTRLRNRFYVEMDQYLLIINTIFRGMNIHKSQLF
jgi:hypothetical protein